MRFDPASWRHWIWATTAVALVWFAWNLETEGEIRESVRDRVSVVLLAATIILALTALVVALVNKRG